MEIPDNLYSLVPNQSLAPMVDHIITSIAADNTLEYFGHYNTGDANTEIVQLRCVIPVPFKYTSIFLAQPITPRIYF